MTRVLAEAVKDSDRLLAAVRPGKQALRNVDRQRVSDSVARVTDSLDLDAEFLEDDPEEPRWDYLTGVERTGSRTATCVVAIEVHPAVPREVKSIISKKRYAIAKLQAECGENIVAHWYWIASGKVDIPPTTSEYRELLKDGIKLVGHLNLTSC